MWRCRKNRATCKMRIKTKNSTLEIVSKHLSHNHDATGTDTSFNVSESSKWQEFINRREQRSLRIDNFVYFRKRENNGTIIWYCSNKSCKARAQCDDRLENRNIIHGAHNHPPKSDEFFLSASITHGVKRRIPVDASKVPRRLLTSQ